MITLSTLTRRLVHLKDALRRYGEIQPGFDRKYNPRHSVPIAELIELTELAAVTCGQGDWYPKTFGELGMDAEFILAGRRCIKLGTDTALVIGKFRRVVTADTRVMAKDAAQDVFASGLIDTLAKTMDVPRNMISPNSPQNLPKGDWGVMAAVHNTVAGSAVNTGLGGKVLRPDEGRDALTCMPAGATVGNDALPPKEGLIPDGWKVTTSLAHLRAERRDDIPSAPPMSSNTWIGHDAAVTPGGQVYGGPFIVRSDAPACVGLAPEVCTAVGPEAGRSLGEHEKHFSELKVGQRFKCEGRPYVKTPATGGARLLDESEGPGGHIHHFDPLQVVELAPHLQPCARQAFFYQLPRGQCFLFGEEVLAKIDGQTGFNIEGGGRKTFAPFDIVGHMSLRPDKYDNGELWGVGSVALTVHEGQNPPNPRVGVLAEKHDGEPCHDNE